MPFDTLDESAWSVVTEVKVRWGDMDAFNHVNNTIYFRYMETARIDYFNAIGLMGMMRATGVGPILAHTSCQFIQPVTHPDTLRIAMRLRKMGNSSLVHEYEIHSERLGLAAKGDSVVVSYDFNKNEKAPLPEALRLAVMALEGRGAWDGRQ